MTSARILVGDVRERLRDLPDGSVHCAVTSPPYWGLRDYGAEGQIGLEESPDAWVAAMVETMREVRRVLRDDGTLWLNLGDSYNAYNGNRGASAGFSDGADGRGHPAAPRGLACDGLKPKDLIGQPWLLAFALRADGWFLRSEIIWHKPNPMPESCTDRPTKSHEQIFLLSKRGRYFYDADAVREACPNNTRRHFRSGAYEGSQTDNSARHPGRGSAGAATSQRNQRDVWTIATHPYPGAHFATFPPALPEKCIRAGTSEHGVCPGCGAPWVRVVEMSGEWRAQHARQAKHNGEFYRTNPGGGLAGPNTSRTTATTDWRPTCDHADADPIPATVLDPFTGAGTTAVVALKLGRDFVGTEINPEYAELARKRIAADVGGLFATVTVDQTTEAAE